MTGSVKIYEKDDTKSVIENIDNCSIRVKENIDNCSIRVKENIDNCSIRVKENIDNCSIRVKEFDIEKGELVKND